jgi:hypothetical protein
LKASASPESSEIIPTPPTPKGGFNLKLVIPIAAAAVATAYFATGYFGNFDINIFLEQSVTKISDLGPYGYLYFALVRKNCS